MNTAELTNKIDAIERGPESIAAALAGVPEPAVDHKPAPGKWSIREIVAHLADVEVIYGYRLRQMLADREPTIAPIDQEKWAEELAYDEAEIAESLEAYRIARRANMRLLRRVQVSDLSKSAYHPERKREVTVEELIGMMAGHDPNHLGQIQRLKEQALKKGA
jgi:uncharacterized damage-inducible protein DinB